MMCTHSVTTSSFCLTKSVLNKKNFLSSLSDVNSIITLELTIVNLWHSLSLLLEVSMLQN